MQLTVQPHLEKRLFGAPLALPSRYAAYGEGELHVLEDRQMRNQVVALKDKPDTVIAVAVPIPVLKIFRGDAVHDEIAVIVAVESADDVEEGRFSRTGRSQHADEFAIAEIDTHVV